MAIDNAEKRRSAAGVGFWVVGPGVTPNSSRDVQWRVQAGWAYSGLSVYAPAVAAGAGAGEYKPERKYKPVLWPPADESQWDPVDVPVKAQWSWKEKKPVTTPAKVIPEVLPKRVGTDTALKRLHIELQAIAGTIQAVNARLDRVQTDQFESALEVLRARHRRAQAAAQKQKTIQRAREESRVMLLAIRQLRESIESHVNDWIKKSRTPIEVALADDEDFFLLLKLMA